MPVHPYFPGNNSSGESVEDLMAEMPVREVFVKDTDGQLMGTGMRMLPDGTLLAPGGFSVESGSIDFGDAITMSESSGFVGIRNNLYNAMYQLIDYGVPRTSASLSPTIFQLNEAEWMFTAQADDSVNLTSSPLVFNYTTTLNARTNSITFRASAPMSNVRIKITKSDVNVALKYLPSKSVWSTGTGGMNFVVGDNVVDFKDSPVPLSAGVMLTFEIRANTMAIKGNSSGIPYFSVMTQRGEFVSLPLSPEVTAAAIRDKLVSLSAPNKLPKTAIQDGVLTVNGQFGDVVIPAQVNSDWNSVSGVSQILNKPTLFSGSYTDLTNKPTSFPPSGHTHSISDVIGLQTALDAKYNTPTGTTLQYLRGDGSLATFPSIPAAQVNSDWNSVSGVSQVLNKPSAFTPSAHTQAWSTITTTPTTLSGYGIIDAYPLASNPAGYLTTITSGQITTALGYTPYNGTTNPNSYITQAGARTAISLTTTGTSGAATYNSTTGVLNVPNYANSGGTVTSITAGTGLSGGTITTTGTISMPNVGTAGSYNGTITTDAQGRVTAGTNRSFTNPTRSLNTAFQISATQDALVAYSVDISCTAALLAGQAGRVVLEYANEVGFTTGVTTVQTSGASAGGVLNLATLNSANLTGCIPAGKYVRLRTVNTTGTPVFTYQSAQEVLLG